MSGPLCTNSGIHLFPENTALITEIEATGQKYKPKSTMSYIEAIFFWGRLSLDLTIKEILMKSMKSTGGLTKKAEIS